jgi:NAD(P)-dependent dehydrogenase (short-subunit alcohol dehydrogenase family)
MGMNDDLAGRVAVVTGANSGIGLETARDFALRGARVVMACRSAERASAARDELLRDRPDADITLLALDLADLTSVRLAAEELRARHARIDILVNNAGVMAIPLTRTSDGFEMQFGANHLGHFALTGLVLDRLLAAEAGRVVSVSSVAHVAGFIQWRDPHAERGYFRWSAYCQSKLANLLFALELDRRLRRTGARALANACHPGMSATNLQFVAARMERSEVAERFWRLGNELVAQSAADGAKPTIFAATSREAQGGAYYGPDRWLETRGEAGPAFIAPQARDAARGARLWSLSEELTGVRFEF